jgi:hypothetical protein
MPELRVGLPAVLPPRDDRSAAANSYLEDLVAIAVAAARQAEDAAREALATGRAARKRMYTVAAAGAIGLLAAIAAIAGRELPVDQGVSAASVTPAPDAMPPPPPVIAAQEPPPDPATNDAAQSAPPAPQVASAAAMSAEPSEGSIAEAAPPPGRPMPLQTVEVPVLPLPPYATPVEPDRTITPPTAHGSHRARRAPTPLRLVTAPLAAFAGLFAAIPQGVRAQFR